MLLVIILGCVGFRDAEEKPNEAYLDNVIVVEKKPMTIAELDRWAETARF
jgi:hypothetical protein